MTQTTGFDAVLDARGRVGVRRGEPRRRLDLATGARQGERTANVAVINISQSGLLLRTSAELALDEPLMVRLPDGGERAARVVWSADDLFGCRFVKPLTRAELSAAQIKPGFAARAQAQPARSAEETLGQRIKRERAASGLTLVELATLVGVSKPTLWKWESDKVRPRQETMKALATALGIGELELVYGPPGHLAAPAKQREPVRARTLAEVVSQSRRAIAEAAGIDEDRIEISIDLGP